MGDRCLGHDAVAEVAVIGEPDEDLGERIAAFRGRSVTLVGKAIVAGLPMTRGD